MARLPALRVYEKDYISQKTAAREVTSLISDNNDISALLGGRRTFVISAVALRKETL